MIKKTFAYTPVNAQFKDDDMKLWEAYKKNKSPQTRQALMQRFAGVINSQVNTWVGPVSRDVLMDKAKLLAVQAFDTYNPKAGASLATYLTNQLMPLSRVVYTYQNTARMPENITQKLNTYNTAVNSLTLTYGREPTTDELHNELGWSAPEITRIRDYNHKDLVESGPAVAGDFFDQKHDSEDDFVLGGIYMELSPDEKKLFECITGYNGARKLSNPEIMSKLHLTQAQLSYKKTLLTKRIESIMKRPSIRSMMA